MDSTYNRWIFRISFIALLLLLLNSCLDNVPPLANAGPDQIVAVGSEVQLDGSRSTDREGDAITYDWQFVHAPDNVAEVLSDPTSMRPTFVANMAGVYELQLIVRDGSGLGVPDFVKITATNSITGFDHTGIMAEDCISCHNGVVAMGKTASHIASTDFCGACHAVQIWAPVITVDHQQVLGACSSCHNGIIASGKSPNHINTNAECDVCHNTVSWITGSNNNPPPGGPGIGSELPATHIATSNDCFACHSTAAWVPVIVVDHSQVLGTCDTCHNGATALGKTANHINTSAVCEACHSTISWAPAIVVDHNEVIGMCVDCHNGVIATGKSVNHIASNDSCENCHNTQVWITTVDPNNPPPTGNGSELPVNHISTSNNCFACHSEAIWVPVIMVDHSEVIGECVGCHNNVVATGKSATHLITSDVCSACHAAEMWVPAITVDHNEVLGACSDCHNALLARGKPRDHIQTDQECDVCHTTRDWDN